jgi:chemotaxis protein MotB
MMDELARSRRHHLPGGTMSQSPNEQDIARALRPPSPLPWLLLALVMVGAVAGAAWFNDQRGKTGAALRASEQKAAATEAERAKLAERVAALEAEKGALENQKAELTSANESLARDVEEKVDELALLNGTANGLQEQLKEEIAKGDVRVAESGGKLRVDLVDKVLFDSGETQISKRGEEVLGRVGAVLAQIDDKQIQVSGHTDNLRVVGEKLLAQFPTNWELSSARAVNVVRFLAEKAGVPAQRLVASGYADLHPIASNKTPVGRARNRRIEILLTPLLDPKRIALSKLPKPAPVATVEKSGKGVVAEAPAHSDHPKKK